ncbi:hypothetical protein VQ03_04175 [Methylobacterium tarhaniae]|uniref:Uncharacterized protein n=1 Tax=Methylobacterium tarhaniae TaxID=1187852 RepID=A0A0J6VXV4_9HYPH|nr:hypothetical protein VQ03_04175 [Methylobacterium tarhaniae]
MSPQGLTTDRLGSRLDHDRCCPVAIVAAALAVLDAEVDQARALGFISTSALFQASMMRSA